MREAIARSMLEIRDRSARFWGQARVGEPRHFRWLAWILGTTLLLNLLDALFTLLWVKAGLATEENVFVRELVNGHAALFLAVKISLVSLGALVLWRLRSNPAAVVGIFVSFFLYYVVFLYHLRFAGWLYRRLTAA